MNLRRTLPLAAITLLALSTATAAQIQASTSLGTITLFVSGQENVAATGSVQVTEQDLSVRQPAHVFGLEQSKLAMSVDVVPQRTTSWHHSALITTTLNGSTVARSPQFNAEVNRGAASCATLPATSSPSALTLMCPFGCSVATPFASSRCP